MENDYLINFIEECKQNLENLDKDKSILYETYFFKIYVIFEKFLGDLFVKYCLGETSSQGYIPKRRLQFDDRKQLETILNSGNFQNYTDYISKIEKMSEHIFQNNPFSFIFDYCNYATYFEQMKSIRNYVAHESDYSKKKYCETCLGNGKFIPPCDFLKSIHKGKAISNYTFYINKMIEVSNILIYPPDNSIIEKTKKELSTV